MDEAKKEQVKAKLKELVDRSFNEGARSALVALKQVMQELAPGRVELLGLKPGIDTVVALCDVMVALIEKEGL